MVLQDPLCSFPSNGFSVVEGRSYIRRENALFTRSGVSIGKEEIVETVSWKLRNRNVWL